MRTFILSLIIAIPFFVDHLVLAQERGLAPGQNECPDGISLCQYVVKNVTPSGVNALIYKVKRAVYADKFFQQLDGGSLYVDPTNKSKIIYWDEDDKRRESIKKTLMYLDQKTGDFPVAPGGGYVMVTLTTVYLDDAGLFNFDASVQPFLDKNSKAAPATRLVSTVANGISSLVLNAGNLTTSILKFSLDLSNTKSFGQEFFSFSGKVINGENINLNQTSNVFTEAGTSSSKEKEDAGDKVSGQVIVNSQDPKRIQISNLSVTIAKKTDDFKNSLTERLFSSYPIIDLVAGVPKEIIRKELSVSQKTKQNGFLSVGRSNDTRKTTVVAYITVTPVQDGKEDLDS